jgi:hypothetical protein
MYEAEESIDRKKVLSARCKKQREVFTERCKHQRKVFTEKCLAAEESIDRKV